MNLLVVTHFYPSHGGGIEAIAGQLVRHLLALDPDLRIEWCAARGDALPPAQSRLRLRPLRVWNGIEKAIGVPIPWPSLSALGQLWRAVRRADAVHFHDLAYPAHLLLALFCVLQGKPYLVTQHIGSVPFANPVFRAVLTGVNRFLGRAVLDRAAQVVFYSEEVRRYFGAFGVGRDSKRITHIPNGVDSEIFFAQEANVRQETRTQLARTLKIDPSQPLVLFVGRFVEKKGVLFLAQLSKRFPEVGWIFAGYGPLDPEPHLGSNGRVLRGLQGASIAQLFNAADLMVLPSRGEGFPLVVQEAFACGTPVLVESAIEAAAPVIGPWANFETLGLDDDASRWENKLRQILHGALESLPERTARAEFAAREWSWERCAQAYLSLFEDMFQGHRDPRKGKDS
jgi:glycosyltransferase involved in cell wall biosynthesis